METTVSMHSSYSKSSPRSAKKVKRDIISQSLQPLQISPVTSRTFKSHKQVQIRLFQLTNKILEVSNVESEITELSNPCFACTELVEGLKHKILLSSKVEDKYRMLMCLPKHVSITGMMEEFGIGLRLAKAASKLRARDGPFSTPNFNKRGRKVDIEIEEKVKRFYLDENNSRISPRANDTIMIKTENGKERVAKLMILNNLGDFYAEFQAVYRDELKNGGMKIGLTKFATLRPPQCRWPGAKGHHRSCTCEKHKNFRLMMEIFSNGINKKTGEDHDEISEKETEEKLCYLANITSDSKSLYLLSYAGKQQMSAFSATARIALLKMKCNRYWPSWMMMKMSVTIHGQKRIPRISVL